MGGRLEDRREEKGREKGGREKSKRERKAGVGGREGRVYIISPFYSVLHNIWVYFFLERE